MIKIFNHIIILILFFHTTLFAQLSNEVKERAYYEISTVDIPENITLEVGGMAFNEQGELAVCTRRGEVWIIDNPGGASPTFKRFAHGLHEPLGLAYRDGVYFTAQRSELTKLQDTNNDGRADIYEPVYIWPLEGNYHEYSYGPVILPDGNMLVTLNLGWIGRGASLSKWRGWMIQISPDGQMTPIATGMRSPAGFGLNAEGDVFYTENQGDWVGSGRMTHVELGDFVGNPEGLKWTGEPESPLSLKFEDITDTLGYTLYEYAKVQPEVKPPSVWFPHTLMGISTSDVLLIDDDESVGPFKGQLLIGDQGHSKIMRVFQEKVNGVYQGACFPFREGFSSGVLRMAWGPDKSIYVGMTNRGWASTGKSPYGLQRLVWNKKNPFEIKAVKAQEDGFLLEFTQEVDRRTAANPDSYQVSDFTYLYHHIYGSPATNVQTRTIYKVEVAQDGLSARLFVEGLREGYVNEIRVPGLRNRSGQALLHDFCYYTLNQIPGGGTDHSAHEAGTATNTVDLESPKRITEMPSSWFNGADVTLNLGTKAGMLYDKEELRVKAGSKVKLVFNNPDDMMHNFVLVKPGQATKVGELAIQLGLQGQEKGYIPDSDLVLYHTNLLEPNASDIIYFVAPEEPGNYEFVCTFPAHAASMRGVFIVE